MDKYTVCVQVLGLLQCHMGPKGLNQFWIMTPNFGKYHSVRKQIINDLDWDLTPTLTPQLYYIYEHITESVRHTNPKHGFLFNLSGVTSCCPNPHSSRFCYLLQTNQETSHLQASNL